MTNPTQAEIEAALKEMPADNAGYDKWGIWAWYHKDVLRSILSQPEQQEAVGDIDVTGFIDKIFTTYWNNSCCDIEGADIQDLGEAFGIIQAETYDSDKHGCHHAADWEAVQGESTIFVLSDAFKAMRRSALTATKPAGWRTIDSVPRDMAVILYAPDADYGRSIYVGSMDDNGYAKVINTDCQSGCGNTGNPTHWMPLPPEPDKSE